MTRAVPNAIEESETVKYIGHILCTISNGGETTVSATVYAQGIA